MNFFATLLPFCHISVSFLSWQVLIEAMVLTDVKSPLDIMDLSGRTPLALAVQFGNLGCSRLLLGNASIFCRKKITVVRKYDRFP